MARLQEFYREKVVPQFFTGALAPLAGEELLGLPQPLLGPSLSRASLGLGARLACGGLCRGLHVTRGLLESLQGSLHGAALRAAAALRTRLLTPGALLLAALLLLLLHPLQLARQLLGLAAQHLLLPPDRKSTRLNSSHQLI